MPVLWKWLHYGKAVINSMARDLQLRFQIAVYAIHSGKHIHKEFLLLNSYRAIDKSLIVFKVHPGAPQKWSNCHINHFSWTNQVIIKIMGDINQFGTNIYIYRYCSNASSITFGEALGPLKDTLLLLQWMCHLAIYNWQRHFSINYFRPKYLIWFLVSFAPVADIPHLLFRLFSTTNTTTNQPIGATEQHHQQNKHHLYSGGFNNSLLQYYL